MEALGVNLPGLITQIVNFGILFTLLFFLLYKPLLRVMDQRSSRIQESLETAERMKKESEKRQEEMRKEMEEARREAQQFIAEARESSGRYREEEKQRARLEAEAFIERARGDIQRERDQAIEEVRREFADLAITAAEQVIRRSLDKKAHQDIIQEVLNEASILKGR